MAKEKINHDYVIDAKSRIGNSLVFKGEIAGDSVNFKEEKADTICSRTTFVKLLDTKATVAIYKKLDHCENIVSYLFIKKHTWEKKWPGFQGKVYYCVFPEECDAKSLVKRSTENKFSLEYKKECIVHMLYAIKQLHDRGIVHGNINDEKFRLNGQRTRVKLLGSTKWKYSCDEKEKENDIKNLGRVVCMLLWDTMNYANTELPDDPSLESKRAELESKSKALRKKIERLKNLGRIDRLSQFVDEMRKNEDRKLLKYIDIPKEIIEELQATAKKHVSKEYTTQEENRVMNLVKSVIAQAQRKFDLAKEISSKRTTYFLRQFRGSNCDVCLSHPFLWKPNKCLDFMQTINDMQQEDKNNSIDQPKGYEDWILTLRLRIDEKSKWYEYDEEGAFFRTADGHESYKITDYCAQLLRLVANCWKHFDATMAWEEIQPMEEQSRLNSEECRLKLEGFQIGSNSDMEQQVKKRGQEHGQTKTMIDQSEMTAIQQIDKIEELHKWKRPFQEHKRIQKEKKRIQNEIRRTWKYNEQLRKQERQKQNGERKKQDEERKKQDEERKKQDGERQKLENDRKAQDEERRNQEMERKMQAGDNSGTWRRVTKKRKSPAGREKEQNWWGQEQKWWEQEQKWWEQEQEWRMQEHMWRKRARELGMWQKKWCEKEQEWRKQEQNWLETEQKWRKQDRSWRKQEKGWREQEKKWKQQGVPLQEQKVEWREQEEEWRAQEKYWWEQVGVYATSDGYQKQEDDRADQKEESDKLKSMRKQKEEEWRQNKDKALFHDGTLAADIWKFFQCRFPDLLFDVYQLAKDDEVSKRRCRRYFQVHPGVENLPQNNIAK